MELVSPARICSIRRLNLRAWLFGVGLAIPFLLTACLLFNVSAGLSGILTLMAIASLIDLIVFPLWALKHWRFQLATWTRRLRAIIWTSAGLFTLPYSVVLGVWANGARSTTRVTTVLFTYVGLHVALIVIWSMLSLLAWTVIASRWPFRFQDGSSCPQCGYCVRGVTSRICPECGRAFCETDLGLSIAEFEKLLAGNTDPPAPANPV